MFAHAGGAAALDAPTWLLAYGAAALVLVVTVWMRGRLLSASARGSTTVAGVLPDAAGRALPLAPLGRVLGVGGLLLVIALALFGPEQSAANLAPPAVF